MDAWNDNGNIVFLTHWKSVYPLQRQGYPYLSISTQTVYDDNASTTNGIISSLER